MEDVLDDAVGDEQLPLLVPVDAPGVRRAVGVGFELVPQRVIPPDAAVHRRPLSRRRARLAEQRVAENAVAAVEPAVRPPGQVADDVVPGLEVPAVEQDLRRAVGLVVAVFVGDEDQVRHRGQPDAAEADLDAAQVGALVEEDRPLVVRPSPSVSSRIVTRSPPCAVLGPGRIRQALHDPDPPAVVDGERHRLRDLGLGGEQRRLESRRQFQAGHGLLRRQRRS